jgi:hypothetical protein
MLPASFFSWWYGPGWKHVATSFGRRSRAVTDSFSVSQLGRTLFEPWRRIVTYPGASLAEKWRAFGDNLVSRAIGFVVRLVVLLAALVCLVAILLATAAETIIWPLLPISIPLCLFKGLVG